MASKRKATSEPEELNNRGLKFKFILDSIESIQNELNVLQKHVMELKDEESETMKFSHSQSMSAIRKDAVLSNFVKTHGEEYAVKDNKLVFRPFTLTVKYFDNGNQVKLHLPQNPTVEDFVNELTEKCGFDEFYDKLYADELYQFEYSLPRTSDGLDEPIQVEFGIVNGDVIFLRNNHYKLET